MFSVVNLGFFSRLLSTLRPFLPRIQVRDLLRCERANLDAYRL